jgi:signal transduction histidine kinase
VLHEGRDRVRGLRNHDADEQTLAAALTEAAAHLRATAEAPLLSLVVAGTVHALHPAIQQEILSIACEAIANAYRHAGASAIDAQLRYGARELRVIIRDNGVGIPPAVLATGGRRDHWGMPGMRERARRIKAKLTVCGAAGGGTEWLLVLPGAIAYRAGPRRSWLRRAAPA